MVYFAVGHCNKPRCEVLQLDLRCLHTHVAFVVRYAPAPYKLVLIRHDLCSLCEFYALAAVSVTSVHLYLS